MMNLLCKSGFKRIRQQKRRILRCLSDDAIFKYLARPPAQEQPPWQRLAVQLKDDDNNPVYMNRLRMVHDPKDHVDKLEDEIREEIAQALGRAGSKCDYHFLLLERAEKKCTKVTTELERKEAIIEFNRLRLDAARVRDELIIHRQAIGIRIKNQVLVEEYWPLPPPKEM